MNLEGFRDQIKRYTSGNHDCIHWNSYLNVGWLPITDEEKYDDGYFDKYVSYEDTRMGCDIADFRVKFIDSMYTGNLVDIGIGSGQFIKYRGKFRTNGYDVSQYGINFLRKRNIYSDPYLGGVDAISCWDSLEHIKDCWELIERVNKWVFISVPIVRNFESVKESPHYKPNEHWWYFTDDGVIKCFEEMGFQLVRSCSDESRLGRCNIMTYAFRRVDSKCN